ncbi:site-specific integrase [Paractinoplanes rishiriensis]|uniref:Integrase n=1 Tax=Paractinoplanes rishiriensis TaxID=1050105 RepID=A0A919K894_9ACTN|nr:site-specific integrase [Actinoplanes rishiriensis]GIF01535.1 integrase [Actinoplanes rishiriensis]
MNRHWQIHRVTGTPLVVPSRLTKVAGWDGLAGREQALGIEAGSLFFTDPDYRIDPRLTRYLTRSSFAWLAAETRRSYATDCCVFFDFLWSRGKNWSEACEDDVWDFQHWRRWSPRNSRVISGSKWNRELAALNRLYRWAVADRAILKSPVTERVRVTRGGEPVSVPAGRAREVRSSNVKWLTPRAYRLWRDVGLRGYAADSRRDPSWHGRNDDRNAAYADLLFSSGLRRAEGASLLTIEVPTLVEATHRYARGQLGREVTKSRRARTFYVSADAVGAIDAYIGTTRRAAVRRAQTAGRYKAMSDRRLVVRRSGWRGTTLHWLDNDGQTVQRSLDMIGVEDRLRLYVLGKDGLEPLWLWLAEDGTPFRPHSWEAVYRAASQRCQVVLAGRVAQPPWFTPHMARHSFSLHMLVVLQHALDRRFGLSPEERRAMRELYGDVWGLVRDLLGHASEETTRNIYAAPVADLQIRSLLLEEPAEDTTEALAQLARLSGRVLDTELAS